MNYEWQELTSGVTAVGDVLRVKRNAYSTDAGVIHNGRLVEVTKISNGDIFVRTIDGLEPEILEARHPAYKLEKRIGQ